jgi:hypothetical protein
VFFKGDVQGLCARDRFWRSSFDHDQGAIGSRSRQECTSLRVGAPCSTRWPSAILDWAIVRWPGDGQVGTEGWPQFQSDRGKNHD